MFTAHMMTMGTPTRRRPSPIPIVPTRSRGVVPNSDKTRCSVPMRPPRESGTRCRNEDSMKSLPHGTGTPKSHITYTALRAARQAQNLGVKPPPGGPIIPSAGEEDRVEPIGFKPIIGPYERNPRLFRVLGALGPIPNRLFLDSEPRDGRGQWRDGRIVGAETKEGVWFTIRERMKHENLPRDANTWHIDMAAATAEWMLLYVSAPTTEYVVDLRGNTPHGIMTPHHYDPGTALFSCLPHRTWVAMPCATIHRAPPVEAEEKRDIFIRVTAPLQTLARIAWVREGGAHMLDRRMYQRRAV